MSLVEYYELIARLAEEASLPPVPGIFPVIYILNENINIYIL